MRQYSWLWYLLECLLKWLNNCVYHVEFSVEWCDWVDVSVDIICSNNIGWHDVMSYIGCSKDMMKRYDAQLFGAYKLVWYVLCCVLTFLLQHV